MSKHIKYFETIFNIAEEGPQITKNLIALIELIPIGGSQIHDANIVATMQFYDIKHLLTHNESDFLRFEQIITILPLSIVEEVRTVREKLAEEYNCDIHKIRLMIKETEEEHKKKDGSLQTKKIYLLKQQNL